jgi:uncharacterized protein YbjQ (UPF0145 family)
MSWLVLGYALGSKSPPAERAPEKTADSSSVGLMVELAREAQRTQISALESLDTKAASLIAFAGIVVGLIFSSDFVQSHWTTLLTVGTGLLVASILPLVYVLWRKFSFDPNIGALDDLFSGSTTDATLRWVLTALRDAVDKNARELQRKTAAVRISASTIVLALGLVVGSLINSQNPNSHIQTAQTKSTPPAHK